MFASFIIAEPDKINATLSMTMSLSNWKALSAQLQEKWPATDLFVAISKLLSDMEKRGLWRSEGEGA